MSISRDEQTQVHAKPLTSESSCPNPNVSVIIPCYNAALYLEECLFSILNQRDVNLATVEIVLFDDSSTDDSFLIAQRLQPRLLRSFHDIRILRSTCVTASGNTELKNQQLGCGGARNRACENANGSILIFQDADDVMYPSRIARSVQALQKTRHSPHTKVHVERNLNNGDECCERDNYESHIVGGRFQRIPLGSTPRYEEYHYRLETKDFASHAFRDAPLAMPTVACHSFVWKSVPFQSGIGVPEDLHFLYGAMRNNFRLGKLLGERLVRYRFHSLMTSLSLTRWVLLEVRVRAFEDIVMNKQEEWKNGFSIWGAGRDGKAFYKALSIDAKQKVRMWGDVDARKIGQRLKGVPVVHFKELVAPVVCCVALDRTGRQFEDNLASLKLVGGRDYVHLI